MVKTLIAFTDEIDDIDYALEQIQEQIDFDGDLYANSVGIVSCIPAYVESGVVKALAEVVPFAIAGITTIGTTASGADDLTQLTLTVLTSDDVSFKVAWTDPIQSEDASIIKRSFEASFADSDRTDADADAKPELPKLVIAYAPLSMNVGGDFFNNTIDEATGGIPCFGVLAVDDTPDYHSSQVIYNGDAAADRLAYILVYGDIEPRFHLATISQEKISKDKGVVTKSDGVQLLEINGKSVSEFLISQGLKLNKDGIFEGVNSFPYIVDFNDGAAPLIRVMFMVTPEGYAVCGGSIPEGSILSVGYFDRNEIIKSTDEAIKQIDKDPDTQGILIYSCIGRYFNLEFNPEEEAEKVEDCFGPEGIPYQFTYGGGELCPIPTTDGSGRLVNRYHNCTLIACVF
ncbi:MAG: FIST C-terminal domain-containing protein [Clostridiales Family XIII bacterium]|jgi:hypothetical protein|nr:FIST C-terminal domain-containing protein [Clostridiales Family XIII bacterium]